jgi:hypothetical protein
VRHGEGPADKSEELDERGEQPDGGGDGEDGGVGVGEGGREQNDGRGEQNGAHGKGPPDQHKAAAAGGETIQDLAGWLAQDVRVVETTCKQGEEQVVCDR